MKAIFGKGKTGDERAMSLEAATTGNGTPHPSYAHIHHHHHYYHYNQKTADDCKDGNTSSGSDESGSLTEPIKKVFKMKKCFIKGLKDTLLSKLFWSRAHQQNLHYHHALAKRCKYMTQFRNYLVSLSVSVCFLFIVTLSFNFSPLEGQPEAAAAVAATLCQMKRHSLFLSSFLLVCVTIPCALRTFSDSPIMDTLVKGRFRGNVPFTKLMISCDGAKSGPISCSVSLGDSHSSRTKSCKTVPER